MGAADYLAIAHRFDLIIVEHVPQLCGNTYNEARRFVTSIDALYEARTKLIISSDVSRKNLFLGFDAIVETSILSMCSVGRIEQAAIGGGIGYDCHGED